MPRYSLNIYESIYIYIHCLCRFFFVERIHFSMNIHLWSKRSHNSVYSIFCISMTYKNNRRNIFSINLSSKVIMMSLKQFEVHIYISLICSPCQRQCELLPSLGVRRLSSVNVSHFNLLL